MAIYKQIKVRDRKGREFFISEKDLKARHIMDSCVVVEEEKPKAKLKPKPKAKTKAKPKAKAKKKK